jgi:hypothetical protein
MPWFRTLLWIGTISMIVIIGFKTLHLRSVGVPTVEAFEFAGAEKAKEIVQSWVDASVKHTAVSSIKLDFLFIVCYVLLMINCSNHQMNKERNLVLNNLLRFNIALAVVTFVLDVSENLIMLNNIRSMNDFFSDDDDSSAKVFICRVDCGGVVGVGFQTYP